MLLCLTCCIFFSKSLYTVFNWHFTKLSRDQFFSFDWHCTKLRRRRFISFNDRWLTAGLRTNPTSLIITTDLKNTARGSLMVRRWSPSSSHRGPHDAMFSVCSGQPTPTQVGSTFSVTFETLLYKKCNIWL